MSIRDRLDQDLASTYDALPESHGGQSKEELAKMIPAYIAWRRSTLVNPLADQVVISEAEVPANQGRPPVRLVIVRPKDSPVVLPAAYWIHGGGYYVGNPDLDIDVCSRLALDARCACVAVEYRLSFEAPFPAAFDDCLAGLEWLHENAEELGIDPAKVAVIGGSAGGGLSLALALKARDLGKDLISFLMPLYPMIDDRPTASCAGIDDDRVWNGKRNAYGWNLYLEGVRASGKEITAYMAPAREEDLSGLPPVYTCVGSLDPFRDETISLVERLSACGVPVEFHLYPGCFHGFEVICRDAPVSKRCFAEYVAALGRALHG